MDTNGLCLLSIWLKIYVRFRLLTHLFSMVISEKKTKKSSVLLFIVLYVILEIGEQMQRLMGYLYNFIMKTMWFLVKVSH